MHPAASELGIIISCSFFSCLFFSVSSCDTVVVWGIGGVAASVDNGLLLLLLMMIMVMMLVVILVVLLMAEVTVMLVVLGVEAVVMLLLTTGVAAAAVLLCVIWSLPPGTEVSVICYLSTSVGKLTSHGIKFLVCHRTTKVKVFLQIYTKYLCQ